MKIALPSLLALILLPHLSLADTGSDRNCDEPVTVISSVRVFDGEAVIAEADVAIHCDRILRLSENGGAIDAPEGAIFVNGEGKTLLPGLIDTHTHTFSRAMLERPLDFGVTTVMDMGSTSSDFVTSIRAEDLKGPARDRADLLSAGLWATAPGSHGTQFGEIQTLQSPQDAQPFVTARIRQGADYIKIIYDNFKMFDREIPTLSYDTMAAVVDAAHAEGMLAVVHSRDVEAMADVATAGADGIVHLPVDQVPDDALIASLKSKRIFIGSNLSLLKPVGRSLADDPRLGPMLRESEIENLRNFRALHREGGDDKAFRAVKAFHAAGITIVAGSDTPNGGTTEGASMHLELELLVDAGMTPLDALKAATSNAADAFRLQDRGRIKPGLRADLLLVDGYPDQRITDTRNIVAIWKSGSLHRVITGA